MAGNDPRFPEQQFREGILFAMEMARPSASQDQVTFYRDVKGVYAKVDPTGTPYDWGLPPVVNPSRDEVVVDCVVEYIPRTSMADVTAMGEFNLSRAEILVFKEGYEAIRDIRADMVKLGGVDYRVSSVSPPFAMFQVEFYTINVEAIDES